MPGVVHEDVEAAELVDRVRDQRLRAGPRRDVVAVRDRGAAGGGDLVDDLVGRAWRRRRRLRAPRRGRSPRRCAPSAASSSASPRPMPRPAPVTMATLPSSIPMCIPLWIGRGEDS